MKLSLDDWLKNGWLIEQQTSQKEIADLFRIVDRDLKGGTGPLGNPITID